MNYDWVVIGAGFTGAALACELVKKNFSVLLLEQNAVPDNATRYSYGGLAFWSGTNSLTRQLCDEGKQRYSQLLHELGSDIEYREIDLLLTIDADSDPNTVAESYSRFQPTPQLLSVEAACELEPLLNKKAISGAFTVKHGHIQPENTAQAYIQAFLNNGGKIQITKVLDIQSLGIGYKNLAICAGGISRQLLHKSGIFVQQYFTHAEILETASVDVKLSTLVMPAMLQRFGFEARAGRDDEVWHHPGNEPEPAILDTGVVQFLDGSLRIGQISRTLTDPEAKVDAVESEKWLRDSIGRILPCLSSVPATWRHCLVAFSKDSLPLVGAVPEQDNIYIFSGFSNPLVYIPPLAVRFANWVSGEEDEVIKQLSPNRFINF
ncbi:MAG: FAD-binding oxidoreductase [Calothrix sp. C42_A2020_038]|nr:FAD-binding oxidoreductase [Calothrix sp. C42_A2020_038]